jgi:hypothetical protein
VGSLLVVLMVEPKVTRSSEAYMPSTGPSSRLAAQAAARKMRGDDMTNSLAST